jgi:hypothetical protein
MSASKDYAMESGENCYTVFANINNEFSLFVKSCELSAFRAPSPGIIEHDFKGNSLSFVFNWEYLEIYDTGNIEEKKAVKIPELKKHLQERIISTNFIDTQFFDTIDCCKKDVEQFEYSYLRLELKDEKDFAYIFLVISGFFNPLSTEHFYI